MICVMFPHDYVQLDRHPEGVHPSQVPYPEAHLSFIYNSNFDQLASVADVSKLVFSPCG